MYNHEIYYTHMTVSCDGIVIYAVYVEPIIWVRVATYWAVKKLHVHVQYVHNEHLHVHVVSLSQ